MRKLCLFFLSIFLLYLFIFNEQITSFLSIVNNLFFKTYIVSLFPFIVFTNLVLKSKIIISIHKWLLNKNKLIIFDIFIIILTILIGVPGNINLINNLIKSNVISKAKGNQLIYCFGGISFSFIYLVILQNNNLKYLLIILLIFSEILCYYLSKKDNYSLINITYINYDFSLIKQTGYSLFSVLFSLLFFSLFNYPFSFISSPYSYLLNGLIEFSYNSILLSEINTNLSNLLLIFLLSFSSLSLITQIKANYQELDVFKYIKKRAFIALFALLFTFVLT